MSAEDLKLPILPKIKGLYLFGSPGSGKTFLMDLFFNNINIHQKVRIHFNEFMLGVNKDLHIVEKVIEKYYKINILLLFYIQK